MNKTVAIVYHYFAHYRAAVMRELLNSDSNRYVLVGDNRDTLESGIKTWTPESSEHFIHAPTRFIRKRYLVQPKAINIAFNRKIDTIIYLGDCQYFTTWVSAFIARLVGKRVLFWTQGWQKPDQRLKGFIRCSFYRLAHGLLLYGNNARNIALTKGFKTENLYVIYNSLDYDAQVSMRKLITCDDVVAIRTKLFGDASRPMIVCSSRLVAHRRLDWLFNALSYLNGDGHPVNLLLIGDGPERNSLEKMASDCGLNVCFYGECYDEMVLAGLIMSANVTVAPGMVGLTAMQSLVYGTPVITHDDPERQMPESEAITPGVNGDLFHYGDIVDLAHVIRKWTSKPLPDDQTRISCYKIIEKYYNPTFQKKIIERAVAGLPALSPETICQEIN